MAANDFNAITVDVKIDGKPCDISSLELRQAMNTHHLFSIGLNYRAKEQDLWEQTVDPILELLGKSVSIHISEQEGASIDFNGVINKIDIGGEDSNQGIAMLYGGSPTVLMTDDYSMAAFVETDLASIVDETIRGIGYKIEYQIAPRYNPEIPYICRYRESSYDFLNRLLASCGEWFYYDGNKIIVGLPAEQKEQEAVILSYKHDLKEMRISSTLGNYDVEQYDYDPIRDYIAQWPSPPESESLNKFTRKSFRDSQAIYKDYTILPSTIPVVQRTADLMENSVNATHFNKLSEGSLFRAKTGTCKVSLGSIIAVESDPNRPKYTKELGEYRIIEVVHHYDSNKGEYANSVTGINAGSKHISAKGVIRPTAMPEVAKVVDNKDPKNLGRVKIQFIWQQLEDHPQGKTSSWVRVQAPNAGSSESVEKDRGFFFVPEVGDQVMVGYEYGDPNRPFVMGSLYHKNNTNGMADENNVKSIRTRSGHTLEFNDDESGEWGITIKDRNGSTFHFDTKGKNIQISAPETISFTAKNIELAATENIKLAAEQNIETSSKGESIFTAENKMSLHSDNELLLDSSGNASVVASKEATLQGQDSTLTGLASATVSGQQTLVEGKQTTIQGASHKFDVI